MKKALSLFSALLISLCLFVSCDYEKENITSSFSHTVCSQAVISESSLQDTSDTESAAEEFYKKISSYSTQKASAKGYVVKEEIYAYKIVNNNVPKFTAKEITAKSFESYGKLDSLGRCTVCIACIGKDLMPTEKRGEIGMVKPSGWHTVRYDDVVEGKYLYNRCHLIGYQLSGENKNVQNLITGTRYLNVEGMLPFENLVADYVKDTGNHVMYRVTPIFEGNNLLATGVEMEGYSVEDNGKGVCFDVFCPNVQPGIKIDYKTGDSSLSPLPVSSKSVSTASKAVSSKMTSSKTTSSKTASSKSVSSKSVSSKATVSSKTVSSKVTVPSQAEKTGNLVWVPTNGGKKYHSKKDCSNMVDPIQVSKETAEKNGFTPCKRCY